MYERQSQLQVVVGWLLIFLCSVIFVGFLAPTHAPLLTNLAILPNNVLYRETIQQILDMQKEKDTWLDGGFGTVPCEVLFEGREAQQKRVGEMLYYVEPRDIPTCARTSKMMGSDMRKVLDVERKVHGISKANFDLLDIESAKNSVVDLRVLLERLIGKKAMSLFDDSFLERMIMENTRSGGFLNANAGSSGIVVNCDFAFQLLSLPRNRQALDAMSSGKVPIHKAMLYSGLLSSFAIQELTFGDEVCMQESDPRSTLLGSNAEKKAVKEYQTLAFGSKSNAQDSQSIMRDKAKLPVEKLPRPRLWGSDVWVACAFQDDGKEEWFDLTSSRPLNEHRYDVPFLECAQKRNTVNMNRNKEVFFLEKLQVTHRNEISKLATRIETDAFFPVSDAAFEFNHVLWCGKDWFSRAMGTRLKQGNKETYDYHVGKISPSVPSTKVLLGETYFKGTRETKVCVVLTNAGMPLMESQRQGMSHLPTWHFGGPLAWRRLIAFAGHLEGSFGRRLGKHEFAFDYDCTEEMIQNDSTLKLELAVGESALDKLQQEYPSVDDDESYEMLVFSAKEKWLLDQRCKSVCGAGGCVCIACDEAWGCMHGLVSLLQWISPREETLKDREQFFYSRQGYESRNASGKNPTGFNMFSKAYERSKVEWDVDEVFALKVARVKDGPRFPWRGIMIDVSRHFFSLDVLRVNIRRMALAKLNVLHLHLCDDQAFRIESEVFPKLVELGARDGEYYTKEEMKDLVSFAADHGIRVVPEFDTPGHASSLIAAYPDWSIKRDSSVPPRKNVEPKWGIHYEILNVVSESVVKDFGRLLKEMMQVFPDTYLHLGCDEVPFASVLKDEKSKSTKHVVDYVFGKDTEFGPFLRNDRGKNLSRPLEIGKSTSHALLREFHHKLSLLLEENGKLPMSWGDVIPDKVFEAGVEHEHWPMIEKTVVQSWRGVTSLNNVLLVEKAAMGVVSFGYYLDLLEPAFWMYANEPWVDATPERGPVPIQGGEACTWSEYISEDTLSLWMWPRGLVVAERLWSPSDVMYEDGVKLMDIAASEKMFWYRQMWSRYDFISRFQNFGPESNLNLNLNLNRTQVVYARIRSRLTLWSGLDPDALQEKLGTKVIDENDLGLPKGTFDNFFHLVNALAVDSRVGRLDLGVYSFLDGIEDVITGESRTIVRFETLVEQFLRFRRYSCYAMGRPGLEGGRFVVLGQILSRWASLFHDLKPAFRDLGVFSPTFEENRRQAAKSRAEEWNANVTLRPVERVFEALSEFDSLVKLCKDLSEMASFALVAFEHLVSETAVESKSLRHFWLEHHNHVRRFRHMRIGGKYGMLSLIFEAMSDHDRLLYK